MPKNALGLSFVLGVLGCAAPQRVAVPATADPASLRKEVADLKEQIEHLQNQLGHLQSEVSAASAEDELTEMTIDSVLWADEKVAPGLAKGAPMLLCHVVEWRDFGKMLRFTRKADQTFVLEADGHPPIHGHTGTGGICNTDGSTRFVILRLTEELAPNAAYHLRPLNGKADYRWSVADGVVVMAQEQAR